MALAATPTMQRLNNERIRFAHIVPSVDDGKYPAKRLLGDLLTVEATIFRDSTDLLGASIRYRHESAREYQHTPLALLGNDRWRGVFPLDQLGLFHFTIVAWTDELATWQEKLRRKWDAKDREVEADLQEGATLLRDLADRVPRGAARVPLMQAAMLLADPNHDLDESVESALNPDFTAASQAYPDPAQVVAHMTTYTVRVEPRLAGCAAWYELFPRSQSPQPGRHGTFRDLLPRLPALRELGFDVLYFPPIHPVGQTNRKGKNNTAEAGPGDVGSPWAIGNWQGGHDAVESALGTLDDFRMLLAAAKAHGLEIALDLALNCSPDHPYVQHHPHWFKRRPDGSIAYAENPPKKYQDVYPLDFDTPDWPALWQEILRIVRFWIDQGVKTFRVDNPHTKPIGLWEWLIDQIKRQHPDVILLSEAFTRPAMMKELAKVGFSQSYTYFTWRNSKAELTEYLTELTATPEADYFRPHFFVNTPDILHAYLQKGGKGAFAVRFFLAATLSPLYGLYSGFEFYENTPLHAGSEEYLDSEKYELKHRPHDMPGSLVPLIKLLNEARREHPALQQFTNLTFHEINNDHLLCYSKVAGEDRLIFIVNLDPYGVQDGLVELDLEAMGMGQETAYYVYDLLTNQTWIWKGHKNYVRLDPKSSPAHLLVARTAPSTESAMRRTISGS
jgi:starch synthase (maltosyl-transferring)